MTQPRREGRVLGAVVGLVDSLLDDFDVVELLTGLTEQCAELLDIASAGLLLADPGGRLQLMAATSVRTEELELFQLQADEGPCLDCFATGRPVSVADLSRVAPRWPRFVPTAVEAGFASVHAVPMRAAGRVLGTVGLFGTRTGALSDADLVVGQTLAHVASVAIMQGRAPSPSMIVPNLRAVLASQIVVDQAKGFLRERLDVSVEEAFVLLRRYAREHRWHLTDLARSLLSESAVRPALLSELTDLSGPARPR